MRFKGKERTSWTEREARTVRNSRGETSRRHYTHHYSGKHKIVDFSRPIFSWSDGLKQRSYSLPFSFVLPSNIPGTFYYKNESHAYIIYKFHGIVVSSLK